MKLITNKKIYQIFILAIISIYAIQVNSLLIKKAKFNKANYKPSDPQTMIRPGDIADDQTNIKNVAVTSKASKIKLDADILFNKGFSILSQTSSCFVELEKLFTGKSVLSNDLDIYKQIYDKTTFSGSLIRVSTNKYLTFVDGREMNRAMRQSIIGNYYSPSNSFINNWANQFYLNKDYSTQVYTDTYIVTSLSQNHKDLFPKVNDKMYEEAFKLFHDRQVRQTNSENFNLRDVYDNIDTLKKFMKFFQKYGTHYLNRAHYGFRTGFHSNQAGKLNEKNGVSIDPASDPKDKKQFQNGFCKVGNDKLITNTCDLNKPMLVKAEVLPISDIFSPIHNNSKNAGFGNTQLHPAAASKTYRVIKDVLDNLEFAMRPDHQVVINIQAAKFQVGSENIPCFAAENRNKIYKKIFLNYSRVNKKYVYGEKIQIRNHDYPVPTIKNGGALLKDYQVAESKGLGLYMCTRKNYQLDQTEALKLSQTYYNDVKFVIEDDKPLFMEAGYKCDFSWPFVNKENIQMEWFMCVKETKNPFDPFLITDLKYFEFSKHAYKCSDGYLKVYNDGYAYECDCDLDFGLISDKKGQESTFLCISRHSIELFDLPEPANKPKVKKPNVIVMVSPPDDKVVGDESGDSGEEENTPLKIANGANKQSQS